MATTKTSLAAFLHGKCPRCRHGDIFTHPVSKLSKYDGMYEHCPYCGIRLEPEPGFYQGAMYVSYGFTIACLVLISFLLYLLGNPKEWIYITTIISTMIFLAPLNYRYSRIAYLYLFSGIHYSAEIL